MAKKRRRARGSGSVYRIGGTGPWWIAYRGPDGRRLSESSESHRKGDAERLLQQRVGARANNLPVIPRAERLTFAEAAQAVIDDYAANGKRSLSVTKLRIDNYLVPYFGQRRLVGITAADVMAYITHRQREGIRREREVPTDDGKTERRLVRVKDLANASINRELQALKRIFSLAQKSGRIATRPYIPLLREDNTRRGFFEPEQLDAVLAHLPAHVRPIVRFAYITGWRVASEILPLEWRQIDFKAGEVRLDPHTTKNGEGRTFPMTRALRELLETQQAEHDRLKKAGHLVPWVFVRMVAKGRRGPKEPRQIAGFVKAWKKACAAAGVPGRILHDFRRTAVRNLVRASIPERVAMQMTGHKTRSVFERYNIVSPGDLKDAARKLDASALTPRQEARG